MKSSIGRWAKGIMLAFIACILCVVSIFSAACGESETGSEDDSSVAESSEIQTDDEETVSDSASETTDTTETTDTSDEDAGEWVTFTWTYESDEEGTEATLEYYLFVPYSYDGSEALPLVTWISDSSYVGMSSSSLLKNKAPRQWTKAEKINKIAYFFLTFGFQETSTDPDDEYSEGGQVNSIIDEVTETYSVDTNRLYLTGQSMGGITDFMLNTMYPNKFAATYYVAAQPGGSGDIDDEQTQYVLSEGAFLDQKIVYMTSMLDEKAYPGMHWIMDECDANGVKYTNVENLDYDGDDLESIIQEALDEGLDKNFFAYEQVTTAGTTSEEHMGTWKYAYTIDAIWEWLLSQTLE